MRGRERDLDLLGPSGTLTPSVGYFALTTLMFIGLGTGPVNGPPRPLDVAAMLALLLAQVGGAVHVAVLDPGRD